MPPGEEHEPLKEDLEDVVRLRPARLGVELVPDRVLHPRVRREDEVGGEPGAGPDEVDGREVHLRREPVPAEEPQADEGRLEHERAETLDRKRRAEDVTDIRRESRPVHPELELHHQAGGDADREVDQEERPEKARQTEPLLVAGPVPERLHHRQQRCQPERQGDEDEMEERRQRELPTRQLDRGGRECAHGRRRPHPYIRASIAQSDRPATIAGVPEGFSATDVGKEIGQHAGHSGGPGRQDRTLAVGEAVLLSVVTIVAAWSGYSAAKWGSESSIALAQASSTRDEGEPCFPGVRHLPRRGRGDVQRVVHRLSLRRPGGGGRRRAALPAPVPSCFRCVAGNGSVHEPRRSGRAAVDARVRADGPGRLARPGQGSR